MIRRQPVSDSGLMPALPMIVVTSGDDLRRGTRSSHPDVHADHPCGRELSLPQTARDSAGPLTIITGPNGSGKSSLYRALRLLVDTCQGSLVASLAREGGLRSTLWAGPHEIGRAVTAGLHQVEGLRRHRPIQLRLGFAAEDFGYAVDLGLPQPSRSAFGLDPEIKRECLWSGPVLRPSTLLADRRGPLLRATDAAGAWTNVLTALPPYDSMMTAFADPRGSPEMIVLRERVRAWRFYDHFRTDAEAPARRMQIGTRSPILSHDGANLAAAVQTIREIGDAAGLWTKPFPAPRSRSPTPRGGSN